MNILIEHLFGDDVMSYFALKITIYLKPIKRRVFVRMHYAKLNRFMLPF